MTLTPKQKHILDYSIIAFLGLGFISSQISVALSSIGITCAFILFAFKLFTDRKDIIYDRKLIYLLSIFFIWQIFTAIMSGNSLLAVTETLKKASVFATIIFSIGIIRKTSQINRLLAVLFIFTAVVSVYENIRYILDYSAQENYSLSEFRLAYFGYPITLGEIKMLILILIFPFILNKKSFILNKWLLILISLPVILSLYFTNSRNAMLGLFAGLLIIGIVKHRLFLAGLIIAVALFLFTAPYQIKERIESIVDLTHPSNKARFVMWDTGLKMIADKPLTGFGDIDFLNEYKKYKHPDTYAEGVHLHNNVLQISVLYGIPGFIIWLILILYIFITQLKVLRIFRNNGFVEIILLSSIASMIALQVSGLTEWNFCDAEFAVLFWFIFSFPFISRNLTSEP